MLRLSLVLLAIGCTCTAAFGGEDSPPSRLRVASFAADITPPIGHPMNGGYSAPVQSIEDRLEAKGIVLQAGTQRYVLCALDWCGLSNTPYALLRDSIASAAGTDRSRVALHCLHQHTAVLADGYAQRMLAAAENPVRVYDPKFMEEVAGRIRKAVSAAVLKMQPFDRIGVGQARVKRVASSRRVMVEGKLRVRLSSTRDAELRALPEGKIDPMLKTITLARGTRPLVRLHYYATHPQSFYGDGRVSSDMPGLARRRLEQAEQIPHIYFTGCAGDIAMGKYNDGSREARTELTSRLVEGMKTAIAMTRWEAAREIDWRTVELRLPLRKDARYNLEQEKAVVADAAARPARRIEAAEYLAFAERIDQPIVLSSLRIGRVRVVHLPGEPFVEFQLFAQRICPHDFVAVAGYGEYDPVYIPTERAFQEGGYEPTEAMAAPHSETVLKRAIRQLLHGSHAGGDSAADTSRSHADDSSGATFGIRLHVASKLAEANVPTDPVIDFAKAINRRVEKDRHVPFPDDDDDCSVETQGTGGAGVPPADAGPPPEHTARGTPDRYNVVWDTPGPDASASMPLGNGDIALNAWIEPSGDLVFYIGKTDSWGDNARLLKLGRVRVTLDPPPPADAFRQTLRLGDATMIACWGKGSQGVELHLWVDASEPVIRIEWQGEQPRTATARIELWRTERYELPSLETSDVMIDRSRPGGKHGPTIVEPDVLIDGPVDRIGWYHFNRKSVGPAITARVQGVEDLHRPDPLLHRIFGAVITGDDARRVDQRTLVLPKAPAHRLRIHVLTMHPATPEKWTSTMAAMIDHDRKASWDQQRQAHAAWWRAFWQRSWIDIEAGRSAIDRPLIPENNHSFRIGADSTGNNRFRGRFGRVRMWARAASPKDVRNWYGRPRDALLDEEDSKDRFFVEIPRIGREIPHPPPSYRSTLTFEAWVQPEKLAGGGGRILDKITPGGADGILLDTYPGNSIRLIVGGHQITKKDALPAGRWSHVVAVVDGPRGRMALYVNGKCVGEDEESAPGDAMVVSRAYALQRFINACAGRGRYPIKFNGSLFTVPYPDQPGDADYRRWGPGYWWQNTRLPYTSMCAAGDFDLMQALFRMYVDDQMPVHVWRTKQYFGHDGAYMPECVYFWGDMFSEVYGWTPWNHREDKLQQNLYHKWEWVAGLELTWMMLDYYEYTLDEKFLEEKVLPTAGQILAFFDQHYRTDKRGRLVMHPAQALETWWDCTNPMPEVAGLRAVVDRLLALPPALTTDEARRFWRRLKSKLPDLPTHRVDGVAMLAPAERFEQKHNIENPELYAVFPFRLVACDKANARLGLEALTHRLDRGNRGWRQDEIFMAYLGQAADAKKSLVGRARAWDRGSRFPAFWGPNYDWVPDQDHGSVLLKALQSMVLQTDGRKILLLPAWPRDWNVRFRLHAPYRTVVECEYRDGAVRKLHVTPSERREDIVLPQ